MALLYAASTCDHGLKIHMYLLPSSGHEIVPNTVANATKITALATKIQKLVAKLATRTL